MHETDKRLVDIGSCSLHVVHNAFKAGFVATTWDLRSFMCALHRVFHKSPAREGKRLASLFRVAPRPAYF